MNDYRQYQVEDYLTDEAFIDWVKHPTEVKNRFWHALLADSEQRKKIEVAIAFLQSFQFEAEKLPENFYALLKQDIDSTIGRKAKKSVLFHLRPWVKVAAVLVAVLGVAFFYTALQSSSTVTLVTAFKEVKTFELPDHSTVTLNANSSLEYAKNWNDSHREVVLKGEGFFNVRHIESEKGALPFVVQTNNVAIDVLGTEFNVKNKNHQTAVMLQSGKVRLAVKGTTETHVMQPTDYAVYDEGTKTVNVSTVNPSYHTAWLNHKYIFARVKLAEVCQHLEDFYGLRFIVKNSSLANQEISGTLLLEDETSLFQTLSSLLNATVQQQGQRVIISSK